MNFLETATCSPTVVDATLFQLKQNVMRSEQPTDRVVAFDETVL